MRPTLSKSTISYVNSDASIWGKGPPGADASEVSSSCHAMSASFAATRRIYKERIGLDACLVACFENLYSRPSTKLLGEAQVTHMFNTFTWGDCIRESISVSRSHSSSSFADAPDWLCSWNCIINVRSSNSKNSGTFPPRRSKLKLLQKETNKKMTIHIFL